MQASSKFTTAIHICIFLKHSQEDLISSQRLAASVKTNPVVIRRLIAALKEHKIIGSVNGARGGFYLNRSIDKISLWDIYRAVRDKNFFNKPKVNPECPVSSNLAFLVDDVYSAAELSMKSILEEVTIDVLSDKLEQRLDQENLAAC